MIALSLSDISLSFGVDKILENISFSINEGDRLGIIGVNGAGKTSLFRIISGEYRPDTGNVFIGQGLRVGILEQNPDHTGLPSDITSLEYMYTAFEGLLKLEEMISECEGAIARAEEDKDENELLRLSSTLSLLNQRFVSEGGLEFRARARGMLMRLGFTEDMLNRRISTLSGGQYTRLALARLLATEPDILMLDEPTNHLDIDSLIWLESFIASYKKTVVIISHDRYFLDKTTSKTLWLRFGGARLYPAPFTRAHELASAEEAELEHRYREQQKEIAKIRANIEFQRRCNREHNFVTIRSKEKQLARMEKIELGPKAPRDIYVSFNAEEDSCNDVLTVKDLSFGYSSDNMLIKNLSFLVRRGERVMILGPNGCGKSTLMKLINSRLTPSEGSLTLGYNVRIGYYDQENRGLSENKTVFDELHDEYPEKGNLELRSTLALFLFGADDIEKPVSALSGGERARLTLAKLILRRVNLLILDEPTNHLDTGSAEALEVALTAFPGTIISVSHDRYFINRIATRIIELCPYAPVGILDVTLDTGDDAFEYYIKMRDMARERYSAEAVLRTPSGGRLDYEEKKRENAKRRAEEKKIERARARAEALEAELIALDEELFGSAASDYVRAGEIDKRKGEIEEELLSLYELIM